MDLSIIQKALRLNSQVHTVWSSALSVDSIRDYLINTRKISEDTVKKYNLMYAPSGELVLNALGEKHVEIAKTIGLIREDFNGNLRDTFSDCLVFPWELPEFGIVGFGRRNINEKIYRNSKTSPIFVKDWTFYGMSQALPEALRKNWIILVEGYFDVMRISELGFANVLGTCGTAVSSLKASAVRRFADNFILIFDSDSAGQIAKVNTKKELKNLGAKVITLGLPMKEKNDPDSFGLKHPEKLRSKLLSIMGD